MENIDETEELPFLDIEKYSDNDSFDIHKVKITDSFAGTMVTNEENYNIESLSKTELILLVNQLNLRN